MAIITLDAVRIYFDPVSEDPWPAYVGYGFLGLNAGSPVGEFGAFPPDEEEEVYDWDYTGYRWRLRYTSGPSSPFYFEFTNVDVDTSDPPSVSFSWSDPLGYNGVDVEIKYFYDGSWTTFHDEAYAYEYLSETILMTGLPDPGPSYCWANKVRTIEVM